AAPTPGGRKDRRRRVVYPAAIMFAALLVIVVTAAIAPPPPTPSASTNPNATTTAAGLLECPQQNTPTRLVTSGPGDLSTGPGVIAAFEHSYFTTRDPAAAADHLAPTMRVTPTAIAQVMADNFPPGGAPIPYCATITPWNGDNTWAVSVDWANEATREMQTWTAIYEVKPSDGRLRIVAELPAS
ncbi:hypothetical protein AAFP30_27975, partial [Gordonia sp. CPCC 205515]